ncbi:MAG: O-antigen ligase family protein [Bacteroidota bacterium]
MHSFSIKKILKTLPLLFLFLIIPFLKSDSTLDQGLLIRFLGLQVIILLIAIISFIYNERKQLIYRSPLLLIIFLFVTYTGFHLLWGNVYSDSIFDWLKTASYFLLLFFIIQIYSYNEIKFSISVFISVLGMILTIFGLTELIELTQIGKLNIPLSTYQLKTFYGHRNLFAQILFLTLPFQIYQFLITKNQFLRVLHIVFAGALLFLLIILSNRAVWLALIFGTITVLIINLLFRKKTSASSLFTKTNSKLLVIYLIITLLFSGLFITYFTQTTEAKDHFTNIVKADNGSVKDRLELWERSLKIIKEKPLLGYGAANWKIEMLKYGSEGLISKNNITFYQRPHNDFLWVFSEFGIIGGILYLLIFISSYILLILQIKSEKETQNILFQYAIIFCLTGITIFSFLSFPHERMIHNIILFSFFAAIITYQIKDKPTIIVHKTIILKIIIYSISFIIISASTIFGYQRFISESYTKNALIAKNENDQYSVITQISKATSSFYQMDPLSTPLSWYKGLAWYQLGETDSATKYLHEAYTLNPYHIHVLNNLASAYAQNNQLNEAVTFYKKTIKIYPKFEEATLNLCAVYFNSNQVDSALTVLANIDIESQNPKFKTFIKAVLKSKFTEILQNQGKQNLIVLLPNDKEWYYQQYKTSVTNNLPINKIIFDTELFNQQ